MEGDYGVEPTAVARPMTLEEFAQAEENSQVELKTDRHDDDRPLEPPSLDELDDSLQREKAPRFTVVTGP